MYFECGIHEGYTNKTTWDGKFSSVPNRLEIYFFLEMLRVMTLELKIKNSCLKTPLSPTYPSLTNDIM